MRALAISIGFWLLLASPCSTVQSSASATCDQSRRELEGSKQLVLDFFAFQGSMQARAERFLTPDYIQHNPRLLRMDEITGAKGRDAWLKAFEEAAQRRVELVDLGGIRFDQPVIVMAECDLVTAMYKGVLRDPDQPSRTYEAFAFEMFRVRDGKFSEHWDQVSLKAGWMRPAQSDDTVTKSPPPER